MAAIGYGTLMAFPPGSGILAHRKADGTVAGYVALNKPHEWIGSIDFVDRQAGLRRVADHVAGWAPHLVSLITCSTAHPVLRLIHALPVGHQWSRTAGLISSRPSRAPVTVIFR